VVPTGRVANEQSLACLSGSERPRPRWFLDMKYQTCFLVVLKEVTVMESYGYGYNTMMIKLDHCLFHHNYWRMQIDSNIQHFSTDNNSISECKLGGNALFRYELYFKTTTVTLHISLRVFAHGIIQHEALMTNYFEPALLHGGGLVILINLGHSAVAAVNITINNCSMHKNTACWSELFPSVNMPSHSLITVHINNWKFWGGKSTNGGGFLLQFDENVMQVIDFLDV